MRKIDRTVNHHSAISRSIAPQADRIRRSHRLRLKQNGAYHFFLEAGGKIVAMRPLEEIGYHAGVWLVNRTSIGICLAGDFTKEQPTAQQIASLEELTSELQRRFGIADSMIFNHRDIKATACPGIDLKQSIFDARAAKQPKVLLDHQKAIERAENALRWARGARFGMLKRLIDRLRKKSQ